MTDKQKILIVDDEPTNIAILTHILSDYEKMAVFEGGQVLEAATARVPPDLILLDIMMPEMDGFEVCRQLKMDARTADIPIIFVTAKDDIKDERKGLELGAVDYITKPISPPVVLARVRTHLALRSAYQTLQVSNHDLMTQKQYVRSLIDQSMEIIFSLDTQARLVEFNKAAEAAFGCKACDVQGTTFRALFAEEQDFNHLECLRSNQEPFRGEVALLRKDGTSFPAFLQCTLLRDADDQTVGMVGTMRDMTSEKALATWKQKKRDLHVVQMAAVTLNDVMRNSLNQLGLHLNLLKRHQKDVAPLGEDILDVFNASVHEITSFLQKMGALKTLEEKEVGGSTVLDVDGRYETSSH